MLGCLITLAPLDGTTGARQTVRLCNVNDSKVTGLGGLEWEPAITLAPSIGIQFWNGDFDQGVDPGQLAFTFNLAQTRLRFPAITNALWMGAPIEVRLGRVGSEFAAWPLRFVGKLTDYAGEEFPKMGVRAAVDLEPLQANVLTEQYAGTGGIEGGPDIANRLKPLALGRPRNVEPVLINAVDSVYQFSGYGMIEGVEALYERASAFPAAMANFPNYDALVAAAIPPGRWATCNAYGLIRLGAPAAGVITGDIRGHRSGGAAPRGAGKLVQIMAAIANVDMSLVGVDRFNALDAEGATDTDVMLTEQVTFIDAARRLVLPCNWQVLVSNLGVATAIKPDLDPLPEFTLHAQGRTVPLVKSLVEQSVSAPYFRTVMAAERNWRVQTADEIAFGAPLIPKGAWKADETYREGNYVTLPDGSQWLYINPTPSAGHYPPVGTQGDEWWGNMHGATEVPWSNIADPDGTKPQDNADVTSENTSKDTEAVAGKPSAELIDEFDAAKDAIDAIGQAVSDGFEGVTGDLAAFQTVVDGFEGDLDDARQRADKIEERQMSGAPNLLPNGGPENGVAGYSSNGALVVGYSPTAGSFLQVNPATADFWINTFAVDAEPGRSYTGALDTVFFASSGLLRTHLIFAGASGELARITSMQRGGHDFDSTSTGRSLNAVTGEAPTGTTKVLLQVQWTGVLNLTLAGLRLAKIEAAATWSPYTAEAQTVRSSAILSSLDTSYAGLEQRVDSAEGSVSQAIEALSNEDGTIVQVRQRLDTADGDIDDLYQIVDTQDGVLAKHETRLIAGSANLLENGGLDDEIEGWSASTPFSLQYVSIWGRFVALSSGASSFTLNSPAADVSAAAKVTGSLDTVFFASAGLMRTHLIFLGANGTEVGRVSSAPRGGHDFDNSNVGRELNAVTGVRPTNAVAALVQVEWFGISDLVSAGARLAKIEAAATWSPYSMEAQVRQRAIAFRTLDGTYADLSDSIDAKFEASDASISDVARVAAEATGAVAERTEALEASVGGPEGLMARTTEVEGVAADAKARTAAALYQRTVSVDGGTASMEMYAVLADGTVVTGMRFVGDLFTFEGDVLIDGTLKPRKIDASLFAREGTMSWSGFVSPAPGQTVNVPASLTLNPIQPQGRFFYEVYIGFSSNAGQQTVGTYLGKPYYTNYQDDGGLVLRAYDDQGNTYYPVHGASEGVRATSVFSATFAAAVTRGNYDSGIVNEGDYYSRTLSATYTLSSLNLHITWIAI